MKTTYTIIALLLCGLTAYGSGPSRLSLHSAPVLKSAAKSAVVSAYITVDPQVFDRSALDEHGVKVTLDLGNTLCVRIAIDEVASLVQTDGVEYVQLATPVEKALDLSRSEVRAADVQSGTTLAQPFTGKGVVVGIVDSGFDYCHAAFRSADGSLRIRRVWEQGTSPTEGMSSPEAYGYGLELRTADDILNAGGDITNNSHGTHVASIAAGSDYTGGGALAGMAPEADIVLVSMLEAGGGNVNISEAIAYIFDYADEVDKPCVVNLSLGANKGPHDGTSTFDVIADQMQRPGRLIVGAAGNYGQYPFHINARFADANAAPMRTFFDFKKYYSASNGTGDVDIWADGDMELAFLVFKSSTQQVVDRYVVYPGEETEASVELGRNISGTIEVYNEVSPLNGKKHILLNSKITNIRTGYYLGIEVTAASAATVDLWADCHNLCFTSHNIDGFSDTDGASTICEIGGTARSILTVGAYTTRNKYTPYGESTEKSLDETVGALGSFSGYGPTADGRVKPQVTAPGCFISAAVSSNDYSGTLVVSNVYNDGAREHLYGYMQGTSMSSPMVAGIVATWLEAYPELTPEQLADIVKNTSRSDDYTGDVSDGDNKWGYGKVDALAGIRQCVELSGSGSVGAVSVNSAEPYRIYRGDGAVLMFTQDIENAVIEVFDTMGALLHSQKVTKAAAGSTLALPILPSGTLSVVRFTSAAHSSSCKFRY